MILHSSRTRGHAGLAGALLSASLLFAIPAGVAHADATVWTLAGERNTVYLAGSVHALPAAQAELSAELEHAYAAADALVMEVDLDDLDPLAAVEFITSHGTLSGTDTLADLLGAEKYAAVTGRAASIGLPEFAIAKLEPWAAALMLTQVAVINTGYDPQLGIDMQLMERARLDGKPIEGLETVGDQLGIFDARSTTEQVTFLVRAADDVPRMREDLDRLIAAWRRGDLAAMERELHDEVVRAPELYGQLLGARNRAWLPQIEALLDGERDYLVVVGTLHFVGRDGLLDLLQRAGHRPRRLAAPAAR